MIQVDNVTKRYGSLVALDAVSFHVEEGEILGFLGPNGAGKTTAMRIITGYMPPTEGQASVAGFDVFRDSLEVRRRVGYLPETVPLYREMQVAQYLDFAAAIRGVAKRAAAIDRVLEMCQIGDVRERVIGRLSKGYRQRVGLAQALIHDPAVLVLDEPTMGLDPRQIHSVRELIQSLAGQRTVILSSHILPEVSQICQRVLIINRGRIVAEDAPSRLTTNPQAGLTVELEFANPPVDALEQLRQMPDVASAVLDANGIYQLAFMPGVDGRAAVAVQVVGAGWGLLEMRSTSPSLEDIFLQLTTDEPAAVTERHPSSETEEELA
jgi:ABC-2 type transport system ATP-binding protein